MFQLKVELKMQKWLESRAFSDHALKAKHSTILQQKKPLMLLAADAGPEIVRFSVAHCTLNPIEMAYAWSQVKGHTSRPTCSSLTSLK